MIFSDWRRTDHHTMQEAKLLNILHCLEDKQRGGGGGAITSVFGSEIFVGFSGIGLIPFTVLLRVQDNSRKTVNQKNCSPRNRNR